MPLGVAPNQHRRGNHPVQDHVQQEQPEPTVTGPGHEVGRFFRNIGVPDQHVLTKPDVRPERAEREEQLAQIMQMVVVQYPPERAGALQPDREQHDDGQRREHQAGEVVHAVDRAEPGRLQRHHPVETGQGKGDAEKHEESCREPPVLLRPGQARVVVLHTGLATDRPGERSPPGQIEQSAGQEKLQVEPRESERQRWFRIPMPPPLGRPRIQLRPRQEHNADGDRRSRNQRGHRLGDPPDSHAPGRTAGVVQRDEGEASKGDRENVETHQQPVRPHQIWRNERARSGDHSPDNRQGPQRPEQPRGRRHDRGHPSTHPPPAGSAPASSSWRTRTCITAFQRSATGICAA